MRPFPATKLSSNQRAGVSERIIRGRFEFPAVSTAANVVNDMPATAIKIRFWSFMSVKLM